MKKKFSTIVCLVLSFLVCFGMISCSNNKGSNIPDDEASGNGTPDKVQNEPVNLDYAFVNKNGEQYIVFDNLSTYENNKQELATISFTSMKEFKDAVTKGTLTDTQKEIIVSSFDKDESGAILSCDFSNLYTPVLPTGGTVDGVSWGGGEAYSFSLTLSQEIFGSMHYLTEARYNSKYQRDYQDYFSRDSITVSKTENLDRNKVATYYSTRAGDLMNMRYSLSSEGKTIIVDKTFRLSMKNPEIATSTSVPSDVKLYCTEGNQRYIITLYGFVEDPTDEWLSSFGLTEFVDTELVEK